MTNSARRYGVSLGNNLQPSCSLAVSLQTKLEPSCSLLACLHTRLQPACGKLAFLQTSSMQTKSQPADWKPSWKIEACLQTQKPACRPRCQPAYRPTILSTGNLSLIRVLICAFQHFSILAFKHSNLNVTWDSVMFFFQEQLSTNSAVLLLQNFGM